MHFGDDFWRVLEIDLDDDTGVAAAIQNASHCRGRLAETTAHHEQPQFGFLSMLLDDLLGPIGRWIQAEEDLTAASPLRNRNNPT